MARRRQQARPGEIRITYGRLKGERPDTIASWGGEGASSRDAGLVLSYFAPLAGCRGDLVKELEARGYDLSTLVFSVSKQTGLSGSPARGEG